MPYASACLDRWPLPYTVEVEDIGGSALCLILLLKYNKTLKKLNTCLILRSLFD